MNSIDISESKQFWLESESDSSVRNREGKGWSYVNVYSLREVKDVYLLIKQNPLKSNQEIQNLVNQYIVPEGKNWETEKNTKKGRKALEVINALRNFNLIDGKNQVTISIFNKSSINENLSDEDKTDLRKIFFSYFRFNEIQSWFIEAGLGLTNHELMQKKLQEKSKPIFYYTSSGKYVNTFFYDLTSNPDLYFIKPTDDKLMRFWDVFLKWGKELNLIDYFSMKHSNYHTQNKGNDINNNKNFSCIYFLSNNNNIDLIEFAKSKFSTKHIYLPELVLRACLTFRLPIETVKELIMEQSVSNKSFIGLDRISEIFVKTRPINESKKEVFFYPFYKGSFVSHINLK